MADWDRGLVEAYGQMARRAFEKEMDHRKPDVNRDALKSIREEAGAHNVEIWWRGYASSLIGQYRDRLLYWSMGSFAAGFVVTRIAQQIGII